MRRSEDGLLASLSRNGLCWPRGLSDGATAVAPEALTVRSTGSELSRASPLGEISNIRRGPLIDLLFVSVDSLLMAGSELEKLLRRVSVGVGNGRDSIRRF